MLIARFIFILFCLSWFASCQNPSDKNLKATNIENDGVLRLQSRACYFSDADSLEDKLEIRIEAPTLREMEQIKAIMEYAGLPQNFKIFRGDIDNALATVVNNQRYIIYNKDLFARIDQMSNSYWTSLFIIAHEIGHHLAHNISDTSHALNAELDADRFAGAILYNMGADSNQVTGAVASSLISTLEDSKTHPAKEKRIALVKQSWMESSLLRHQSAIPPPIDDKFTNKENITYEAGGILFTSLFDMFQRNDENNFFYGTWGVTESEFYAQRSKLAEYFSCKDLSSGKNDREVSKNYEGIIVDVERSYFDPGRPELLFLKIGILVTKVDPLYNQAGLIVNKRYQLLICYNNTWSEGYFGSEEEFYEYFSGGRRLAFDLIDLHAKQKALELLNLTRALAL